MVLAVVCNESGNLRLSVLIVSLPAFARTPWVAIYGIMSEVNRLRAGIGGRMAELTVPIRASLTGLTGFFRI
jgi:hypothetical protein